VCDKHELEFVSDASSALAVGCKGVSWGFDKQLSNQMMLAIVIRD
jgi:hypothetical protein